MQTGSAANVHRDARSHTLGSDFGAEGNCYPLSLQAAGLGHPSQLQLGLVVP